MALPLPATTCLRPRSSASWRWSIPGGYYGLIYSIGFLVGWPFIMFLMAEPLRNLGRFTFADVASYRLQATPIRADGGDRLAGHGRCST